jgi:hypothetical protein
MSGLVDGGEAIGTGEVLPHRRMVPHHPPTQKAQRSRRSTRPPGSRDGCPTNSTRLRFVGHASRVPGVWMGGNESYWGRVGIRALKRKRVRD